MLFTNWLQKVKELAKLSLISNFKPFGIDSERVVSHKKTNKFLGGKSARLGPYILCKISNFQSLIAQRLSGILFSIQG